MDQVLSYASIRTDTNLNILEKESIEIEWRRDIVPSASAYLVHQIPLTGRKTVSEAEGILRIHGLLNQASTMSGGYNTLGFDDEMLRFSFYRSLLLPYTHQYQQGCSRFDVLPMVVFYYLYGSDVFDWPMLEDRPSFKLEHLNEKNNWVEGRAHEAMVDVEVTLELMKRLKENQSMWDYLMGFFDKLQDQKRTLALLENQGLGIMVDLRYGYQNNYQLPVLLLGPHLKYKNQVMFLRLDQKIEEVSLEALAPLVIKKKYGEPGFLLPYARYANGLKDRVVVEENLSILNKKDCRSIKAACLQKEWEPIAYTDLDASLYDKGFWTAEEEKWRVRFHQKNIDLESCPTERLRLQALRYLWRFDPDKIPPSFREEAIQSITSFLRQPVDHRGRQGLDIQAAFQEVNTALETTTDPSLRKGLLEIKAYIQSMESLVSVVD